MVPFRILTALASLAALSACFYSEVPLIPPGEQVNLPYDGVVLCLADDCRNVMVGEDGVYEITPPREEAEEKPLRVRFQVLRAEDTNPVYLAEVEMRDEPEVSYHYLVAHIRAGAATHVPTYEFAMPACNDTEAEMLTKYGLERVDNYSCRVSDLAAFKAYLIAAHGEDFGTEAFWTED
ncbi:hypothetical protein [Hyphomonas chukchiensis]|uniref:Lipoprotein n=1 Tax=Hyphomonas chukchiensis TaxID=1280947 RepID=A0A062ULV3_9PROT|nr:hypothetical protein [Hyphomonas chukchiensis]KCZ59640.1 hypothetical protein HY30_13625 [Hyphomonas chukchiensis]|tara:strand:+ start:1473 stop:2009 length:537 start_codon:yes stop_codon:yes gene_type:complete